MAEPSRENQMVLLEMLVKLDDICSKYGLCYQLAYGTALGAVRHKGFIPWDDDVDIMVDIDAYDHFYRTLEERLPQEYCVHSANTDPNYEELFVRIGMQKEPHHQVHIDIWPIVGTPRTRLGQFFFRIACYCVYRAFFVKRVPVDINYRNNLVKRAIAILCKTVLMPIPDGALLRMSKKLGRAFSIENSNTLYSLCGSYGQHELIPKKYVSRSVRLEFEGHLLPVPGDWHGYLSHIYGDYMVPKKR